MKKPIDTEHLFSYCAGILFVSLTFTGIAAALGLGVVALLFWPFIIVFILAMVIDALLYNARLARKQRRSK